MNLHGNRDPASLLPIQITGTSLTSQFFHQFWEPIPGCASCWVPRASSHWDRTMHNCAQSFGLRDLHTTPGCSCERRLCFSNAHFPYDPFVLDHEDEDDDHYDDPPPWDDDDEEEATRGLPVVTITFEPMPPLETR